jgi:uncharacterized membrane protein required for colicin V production
MIESLTIVDWGVMSLWGLLALFSALSGLFVSALGMLRHFGSIMVVLFFALPAQQLMIQAGANPLMALVASSLGLWVVSLLVFSALRRSLIDLTKNWTGGLLDRMLGLCFGMARGWMWSSVLFLGVAFGVHSASIAPNRADIMVLRIDATLLPAVLQRSQTLPLLTLGSHFFIYILPDQVVLRLSQMLGRTPSLPSNIVPAWTPSNHPQPSLPAPATPGEQAPTPDKPGPKAPDPTTPQDQTYDYLKQSQEDAMNMLKQYGH